MKHNFKIILILIYLINGFGFAQVQTDSATFYSRKFENLKTKYADEAFDYKEKPVKINTSAWDKFWEAVGRFFSNLFDFGNGAKALSGIEIVFKIIAFLIIGFVIYLIVKVILSKEGGWIFSKSAKKIVAIEVAEEDIHTLDFTTVITKAKNENNYRLATRYYYLWLLKTFSDRNIIEWDIEKTNSDYLAEIANTQFKHEFQFLSYVYEYSWYGEFNLTTTDFDKTEVAFLKLITKK